jgi:hypothetical protein
MEVQTESLHRIINMTRQIYRPVANLALLQWRVVDVAGQCSLITIARRTRQTSSDKSATASNVDRYKHIAAKCNDE